MMILGNTSGIFNTMIDETGSVLIAPRYDNTLLKVNMNTMECEEIICMDELDSHSMKITFCVHGYYFCIDVLKRVVARINWHEKSIEYWLLEGKGQIINAALSDHNIYIFYENRPYDTISCNIENGEQQKIVCHSNIDVNETSGFLDFFVMDNNVFRLLRNKKNISIFDMRTEIFIEKSLSIPSTISFITGADGAIYAISDETHEMIVVDASYCIVDRVRLDGDKTNIRKIICSSGYVFLISTQSVYLYSDRKITEIHRLSTKMHNTRGSLFVSADKYRDHIIIWPWLYNKSLIYDIKSAEIMEKPIYHYRATEETIYRENQNIDLNGFIHSLSKIDANKVKGYA